MPSCDNSFERADTRQGMVEKYRGLSMDQTRLSQSISGQDHAETQKNNLKYWLQLYFWKTIWMNYHFIGFGGEIMFLKRHGSEALIHMLTFLELSALLSFCNKKVITVAFTLSQSLYHSDN